MDRLPDVLRREPRERDATCTVHGAFVSRNLCGPIWSKCPVCEEERRHAEKAAALDQEREAAEAHHARMLATACIPTRFLGRGFDNFVVSSYPQRHALTVARDYAEAFEERRRKGAGLIFAGRPGTGKSHLAGAILQAVLTPHVRYITCADLIRAIRDTWRRDSDRSESQLLGYFEGLDLLVVDEVGVQYGTESEQHIVFDVLDRRYREMRPTILLTNLDKTGLKSTLGERTYDRLTETCAWVPFDWASHRPTARKDAA